MKRPARRSKVNKGIVAAIGAALLGVAAGAATMFFSKKENREAVEKSVKKTVKMGKAEVVRAKKTIASTKKKLVKK